MPRPTRWKGCVNGLKGRGRACFICPPIRLTSTPSKWPDPKLSSSCARLKRALWKHSMRRLLRPYKLFLRAMLKASSSMSDSVYDPYGNRYTCLALLMKDLGSESVTPGLNHAPAFPMQGIGEQKTRSIGQVLLFMHDHQALAPIPLQPHYLGESKEPLLLAIAAAHLYLPETLGVLLAQLRTHFI